MVERLTRMTTYRLEKVKTLKFECTACLRPEIKCVFITTQQKPRGLCPVYPRRKAFWYEVVPWKSGRGAGSMTVS